MTQFAVNKVYVFGTAYVWASHDCIPPFWYCSPCGGHVLYWSHSVHNTCRQLTYSNRTAHTVMVGSYHEVLFRVWLHYSSIRFGPHLNAKFHQNHQHHHPNKQSPKSNSVVFTWFFVLLIQFISIASHFFCVFRPENSSRDFNLIKKEIVALIKISSVFIRRSSYCVL